jgi:hypothetical protein
VTASAIADRRSFSSWVDEAAAAIS